MMSPETVFQLMTPMGVALLLIVGFWYVLPALYKRDYYAALKALLLVGAFRYFGLLFIVPSFSNGLDMTAFAAPASKGDFTVAIIAFVAAVLLHYRKKIGVGAAWLYAITGILDFAYAGSLLNKSNAPETVGAIWPVLIIGGPIYIAAIVLLFWTLVRHPKKNA